MKDIFEGLADYLVLSILDQIWIQEVYLTMKDNLMRAYESEMKLIHNLDNIDVLYNKKATL